MNSRPYWIEPAGAISTRCRGSARCSTQTPRSGGPTATWPPARDCWVELIGGSNLALRESIARKIAAMRAELAGPSASPLEALLVDRVVACWLQAASSDAAVAQARDTSLRQAAFALKRQESAQRRYLTAIGALATVRRLLPPVVEAVASESRASQPDPSRPAATDSAMPEKSAADDPSCPRDAGQFPDPDLVLAFRPMARAVRRKESRAAR